VNFEHDLRVASSSTHLLLDLSSSSSTCCCCYVDSSDPMSIVGAAAAATAALVSKVSTLAGYGEIDKARDGLALLSTFAGGSNTTLFYGYY